MSNGGEAIQSLREALRISPDNLPLRRLLADTLLSSGWPAEAEQEYRQALALAPDDAAMKLSLAVAFHRQGKHSQSLVLVEDIVKSEPAPARAYLLHAILLERIGEGANAKRQYLKAVEFDPTAVDPELAERLGLRSVGDASSQRGEESVVDGRVRAAWEEQGEAVEPSPEQPRITFQDVGGMETVKDEIRIKIIYPMTRPDLYRAYGKAVGGGILLYGPPGCGKTYLARATAGEIEAAFLAIGINDILEMWIGNSERNLHDVFERARRLRPCVLFFDEVDALGASRSDMRRSGGRHLINQFLSEMDGVGHSNEGVLILAATNAPWHLDTAFRRPGRFDRILFVPPPDLSARSAILRLLCRGKPCGEIDYEGLAKKTEHCSGADLKAVVDLAVEQKLREALRDGAPKPLTTKDLAATAMSVRPSTKEWFATARNYALYANQGGIYDDIAKYLKM